MKRLEEYPDAHLRIFDRPALPDLSAISSAYLVGICGTGMGSLAGLFRAVGLDVSGSDAAAYPPMSTRLSEQGISVFEGYAADHLDHPADLTVVGNACTPTHVEAARAREDGLVQASLPEAVAHYFIGERRSIVVAGTHGKTTTTSLLAHTLRSSALDPGFLVGGVMVNGGVSYAVGSGPHFVIEGDEYDSAYFDKRPKFLHYRPLHAIVTSMEFDHADIYSSWEDYRDAFRAFVRLLPQNGTLILCSDDPEVERLSEYADCHILRYGLERDADLTAEQIIHVDGGQRFTPVFRGERLPEMHLSMSGRHNLMNALSVLGVCLTESVPVDGIAQGLTSFLGIKRRQEVRGVEDDVVVVDDFAHHPTAVRATIQATRERWPNRRLVAVFEPRSNSSRRRIFQDGYSDALRQADAVFLSTPPFRHNDRQEDFLDVAALMDAFRSAHLHAERGESADDLLGPLSAYLLPGDVVLIMSNGGFGGIHGRLLDLLKARSEAETR